MHDERAVPIRAGGEDGGVTSPPEFYRLICFYGPDGREHRSHDMGHATLFTLIVAKPMGYTHVVVENGGKYIVAEMAKLLIHKDFPLNKSVWLGECDVFPDEDTAMTFLAMMYGVSI